MFFTLPRLSIEVQDSHICVYSLQFGLISSARVCRLLDSECLLFTRSLTDRSADGWQRDAYPSLRATPCPPPSIHQSLQLAQTPSRSALQFHKLPVTISGTTTLGRGCVSPQSCEILWLEEVKKSFITPNETTELRNKLR